MHRLMFRISLVRFLEFRFSQRRPMKVRTEERITRRVPQLDQRQKVALVAFVALPFLRRRRNFVAFVGVLLKVAAGGVDDALEEIPHKLLNLFRLRFAAVSPRHILQTGEKFEVVAAAVADAIALWFGPFAALQRVDVLCQAGVAGLLVAVHALGHDDDAVLALALPVAVLLDGSAVGEEDDVAELLCSALQALANVLLHLRDVVLDCSEKEEREELYSGISSDVSGNFRWYSIRWFHNSTSGRKKVFVSLSTFLRLGATGKESQRSEASTKSPQETLISESKMLRMNSSIELASLAVHFARLMVLMQPRSFQ
ncbi:hypothetical protein TYRP_012058 [Tyrophagus putrescentiae]|nr:hypothetical protein TYRP_012058 [Tyrophagus putrescentiae]